jgi:hypothetical protein
MVGVGNRPALFDCRGVAEASEQGSVASGVGSRNVSQSKALIEAEISNVVDDDAAAGSGGTATSIDMYPAVQLK